MKIDTSIVSIRGTRIALAFPHSSYVAPGVGDVLLARLAPHFPTLPIMLVTFQDGERAYATFQYEPIFRELNLDDISLVTVDLDMLPDEPDPPF